ncbi:MAG TPA: ABC transporter ATP-binding protein [Thermoanaerobaculia bacterium]|jgi:subfamily B ATP-binding cassette protein MsbA|nr:ABC transporter ATP-binding protein [Thermoanaerobaculia bacterium]
MTVLRRLLRYVLPYRGKILAALAAMVVVAVSTGALVFFFRSLFDDVLAPARGGRPAEALPALARSGHGAAVRALDAAYAALKAGIVARGIPLWAAVPAMLLGALVVKNVFSYLSEFAFNGIGLSMVRDLRGDAYDHLVRQSASFYSRSTTGDLMSRLLGDVELIQGAFGTRIADLFQGALTIAVMLGYVLSLNRTLTLFALVVAPLLVWPIVEISKRLRRTTFTSRERMGAIGEILQETIRGHRIVKTYGMEDFESRRFAEANERYFRVNRKTIRIQAISSPLMEILSGTGLTLLFAYAARRISAGTMTAGDFLSFLIALMTMYAPIKSITKVNLALQQAISSAARIFEMMDRENEIRESPGAPALPPIARAIRFENVSFRYGDAEVVRGVTFDIPAGRTVALVGPSGAGKTTLANLLPRLYDPTGGRITIDGTDIRSVTLASLRGQMALVTQDMLLFNGTARSNIAYGREDATEAAVVEAARRARADEFLSALPGGYDTPVGEDAGRLSGGQRQRLSIARAFFKGAPILILDEATSQLDAESEAAVSEALATLMAGKTTLVIAHRLSTVRRADRIVVLESGRVADEGTHAELIARGGLYRRLYEMQFFDGETPAGGPA